MTGLSILSNIKDDRKVIKLTDQTIDSKEYIKKYLAYTNADGIQYRSVMDNRPHESDDERAELQDFNSHMEHRQ